MGVSSKMWIYIVAQFRTKSDFVHQWYLKMYRKINLEFVGVEKWFTIVFTDQENWYFNDIRIYVSQKILVYCIINCFLLEHANKTLSYN